MMMIHRESVWACEDYCKAALNTKRNAEIQFYTFDCEFSENSDTGTVSEGGKALA